MHFAKLFRIHTFSIFNTYNTFGDAAMKGSFLISDLISIMILVPIQFIFKILVF